MAAQSLVISLSGAEFQLSLSDSSGRITSDLHFGSLDEFLAQGGKTGDPLGDREQFGRYEGAIDALESLVLAAALAGVDV
jgi:hypothetical protein